MTEEELLNLAKKNMLEAERRIKERLRSKEPLTKEETAAVLIHLLDVSKTKH